ncbi:MAG: hypothetical protein GTO62_16495 [Planctomycetales bacterium]|nr:hypothetical protein [Planctomycetales bacterium]
MRHPCLAILGVGVVLAIWLAPQGLPCPRDDDGWYKSPAAELFQHGRLAIPSVLGFLPRADVAFATQPPLYPGMLSGWYGLFGFSLQTTLGFSFTVHVLNALAVGLVTQRLLDQHGQRSARLSFTIVFGAGLIHLGNLAYFDRPEETALLWVWLDVLLVSRGWTGLRISAAVLSGLLMGLAGLTAMWVGILAAVFALIRWGLIVVSGPRQLRLQTAIRAACGLCLTFLVAGSMIFGWYAVWEARWPGIFEDQFFFAMQHLRQGQHLTSLAERLQVLLTTILFNPTQLAATLITLCYFPRVMRVRDSGQTIASSLYLTALIGMLAVLVLRPRAYTYLGATQILLLPCWGPAVAALIDGSSATARRKLGTTLLIGSLLLPVGYVVDLGRWTWQLPNAQRQRAAYAVLAEWIPPGEPVAVTARHWYVFQGRNPWRDAFFASLTSEDSIRACRWLVLDPSVGIPPFLDHFQLVAEVPSQVRADRTFAYSLWQRKD